MLRLKSESRSEFSKTSNSGSSPSTTTILNFSDEESDSSLESEKSYKALIQKTEVYEQLTYLSFNLTWTFITAISNVLLYLLLTYQWYFHNGFEINNNVLLMMELVFNLIIVVDIAVSILHIVWKRYAKIKNFKPRNKYLIFIDIASILWTFTIKYSFRYFYTVDIVWQIEMIFVTFRHYRVLLYFYMISRRPGYDTVYYIFKKYGILMFLLVHTSSCVMTYLGCPGNPEDNWCGTVKPSLREDQNSNLTWYFVTTFYVIATATSIGPGNMYPKTNLENGVTIAIMLWGFFMMDGAFIGAWTSVQMQIYKKHSNFVIRLREIIKILDHSRIAQITRDKTINYYKTFWKQQNGVNYSPLFMELPETLKDQVYLDMYWNALKQTYMLKYLHPAFQRAIASVMTTVIYTVGQCVYAEGEEKEMMIYVSRGTIQILSAQDSESPILTLGVGTVLGEINLVYSAKSPVLVKACSYCVLQCLRKADFWRIAFKYHKLDQIKIIHTKVKEKLENANMMSNIDKRPGYFNILPLKKVKSDLKTELYKDSEVISYQYKKKSFDSMHEAETYTDLYVLSLQQTTLKHSDEIFIRTSWPWILQPSSVFLTAWEYFISVIVLVVSIITLYLFSFERKVSESFTLYIIVVSTVYVIDVIIQIFTAVEKDRSVVTKWSEIIMIRFRQWLFICDVISALPLMTMAEFLGYIRDNRMASILSINRLFKTFRFVRFFRKLGRGFQVKVAMLRCMKYILYFSFLAYLIGCLMYMTACFYPDCYQDSWFTTIIEEDKANGGHRYESPFQLSFYYGTLILALTSYGNISPVNRLELIVGSMFSLFGVLVFCYLIADYSATLMLAERPKMSFIEVVLVVQKYLRYGKMLMINQMRANNYLALQWYLNSGYIMRKQRSIIHDIPKELYYEIQQQRYYEVLAKFPLFQGVDPEVIKAIANGCKPILLPPYEIVMYAGEVVHDMYFIDMGYCEIISAASGKVEKVLGPLKHFCDFDMVLERPGIHNIRTVTHVKILRVPFAVIKHVFEKADLKQPLIELANETKSTLSVQRLFLRSGTVQYHYVEEQQKVSWFIFPKKKYHYLNIDYEKGFGHSTFWNIIKGFMLRRTVKPDGKFLRVWEVIQAVRVFVSGMYYCALPIYGAYSLTAQYLWPILKIVGLIDVYIRFHCCYYNKNGILVTHPRYTAIYYMKHAFLIDICSLLPSPFILNIVVSQKESLGYKFSVETIVRTNTLLQLYRIPGAFVYSESSILKPRQIHIQILKFSPIIMIIFNAMTMIFIALTCHININAAGYYTFIPNTGSWILALKDKLIYNLEEPFYLYITTYYWITSQALSISNSNFVAQSDVEMYFLMAVVLIGYLLFTYLIVMIASSKASIDVNLTIYQEHMKHLVSFMKKEAIPQSLRKKVINHFEYIWKRTHGMKPSTILNKLHFSLHEDCALYLYEDTFNQVPIFAETSIPFFRLLGLHVEEAYFLRESTIIHINDIVNTIYIVHEGEARVIAPDGSTFATLTKGSVFGNIDKAPHSRSAVTVLANKPVDLLCINTLRFYTLAADYSIILNKLKRHVMLENSSYIEQKLKKENETKMKLSVRRDIDSSKDNLKQKIITIGSLTYPMIFSSYFTIILTAYQVAFRDKALIIFVLNYFFDFMHVIRLFAGFYIPFENDTGELVTDLKEIRKRYLTLNGFYRELLGVLPFELFALLVPPKRQFYFYVWLRLNRLLRMWNFYNFFNKTSDKLNRSVMTLKFGALFVYFSIIVHIGTCTLYLVACPFESCSADLANYEIPYLVTLYCLLIMFTHNGFTYVGPAKPVEIILTIVMIVAGKFLMAMHMGYISEMVQYYSYSLVKYDQKKSTMEEYLENNSITPPLIHRIKHYIHHLWVTNKGLQYPVLLDEAPSYIVESVKAAAYGKHLSGNYIFLTCHMDFLRLLIAKLKVHYFFEGDIICQQGDINNMMYFIHKGIVDVYKIIDSEEMQMDHLEEFDCFGIVQGLFAFTPHSHTYKATTICVILTLELLDWAYLLHYYRAARQEIYCRLQTIIPQ